MDSKKEKLAQQRKIELKKLREKLMAGTRDSCLDSFDELNHRKIEKTKVEVRSANAKKFMNMFNNGEVPEGMNAGDRTTLEKDVELAQMRKNKRGEREFFKKMENGELTEDKPKEPKLLIGKLKDNWIENEDDHSREIKVSLTILYIFNIPSSGAATQMKNTSRSIRVNHFPVRGEHGTNARGEGVQGLLGAEQVQGDGEEGGQWGRP